MKLVLIKCDIFVPYLFMHPNSFKSIKMILVLLSLITYFSSAELPSTKNLDELKWKKTNFNLMLGLQLNYLIYNASISSVFLFLKYGN